MYRRLFTNHVYPHISITDAAWKKLSDIIKSGNDSKKTRRARASADVRGILFSATSGGCNGFNYSLNTISSKRYDRLVDQSTAPIPVTVLEKNGAELVVDPCTQMVLTGTTIDYVEADYINNVFESKFIYTPNKDLAASCGCGKSFTVTTQQASFFGPSLPLRP